MEELEEAKLDQIQQGMFWKEADFSSLAGGSEICHTPLFSVASLFTSHSAPTKKSVPGNLCVFTTLQGGVYIQQLLNCMQFKIFYSTQISVPLRVHILAVCQPCVMASELSFPPSLYRTVPLPGPYV